MWEEQKDKETGVQVLLIREEWRSLSKAGPERMDSWPGYSERSIE